MPPDPASAAIGLALAALTESFIAAAGLGRQNVNKVWEAPPAFE
jgi:hypothetical protein